MIANIAAATKAIEILAKYANAEGIALTTSGFTVEPGFDGSGYDVTLNGVIEPPRVAGSRQPRFAQDVRIKVATRGADPLFTVQAWKWDETAGTMARYNLDKGGADVLLLAHFAG